jgi:hypothetical protein
METTRTIRSTSIVNGQKVDIQPTEARVKAGNYKKGHVKLDGFDIAIENPAGSTRSGVDPNGKKWESRMHADYGYFKGSKGIDKDHVDVFIKAGYKGGSELLHIVNQTNKDRTFDEHKVVMGADNNEDALKVYLANYDKGWSNYSGVIPIALPSFKKWVFSGKPLTGPYKP